MVKRIRRKIHNIAPSWLRILRLVPHKQSITLKELGAIEHRSYSSISAYINLCVEKGWVAVLPRTKKSNVKHIHLTDEGVSILNDFRRVGEDL